MDNVVLPEIVIRNDDSEWTNCVSLPKVQVRLEDLLDLVLCWTQKFQSLTPPAGEANNLKSQSQQEGI